MKTVSISTARQTLFDLRKVITDGIPVTMTHKDGNIVMISEADYYNFLEHIYLARDRVGMQALAEAIKDREEGKTGPGQEVEELLNDLENKLKKSGGE